MDEQQHDTVTMGPTQLGALRVEASGTGPPAVLWHSLFVDSASWARVRDALGKSRRLYMIDGPSHGASEAATRRFTLAECADAAVEVLVQLEITEPVDWVGNAWGGHVGVIFAAAHPERCRTLVMIGTPIRPMGAWERRQVGTLVALYRVVGPVGPLLKPVERGLLSRRTRATDPEAVNLVAGSMRRADRRGMYTTMQSVMLARPDMTPTLSGLATPTLIVTGDELTALTPSEARTAAAKLPNGTAAVIADTRHLAPFEAAPAVIELVIAHWRRGSELGTPAEPAHEVLTGPR